MCPPDISQDLSFPSGSKSQSWVTLLPIHRESRQRFPSHSGKLPEGILLLYLTTSSLINLTCESLKFDEMWCEGWGRFDSQSMKDIGMIHILYTSSKKNKKQHVYIYVDRCEVYGCTRFTCINTVDILIILLMDKILHHQGWWLSHYL